VEEKGGRGEGGSPGPKRGKLCRIFSCFSYFQVITGDLHRFIQKPGIRVGTESSILFSYVAVCGEVMRRLKDKTNPRLVTPLAGWKVIGILKVSSLDL
jgi:hypothetical protein